MQINIVFIEKNLNDTIILHKEIMNTTVLFHQFFYKVLQSLKNINYQYMYNKKHIEIICVLVIIHLVGLETYFLYDVHSNFVWNIYKRFCHILTLNIKIYHSKRCTSLILDWYSPTYKKNNI